MLVRPMPTARYQSAKLPLPTNLTAVHTISSHLNSSYLISSHLISSHLYPSRLRNRKYAGTIDAFRKVWRSEGVAGLYRGFGPAMARSVPANAACFLAYEVVRDALGR